MMEFKMDILVVICETTLFEREQLLFLAQENFKKAAWPPVISLFLANNKQAKIVDGCYFYFCQQKKKNSMDGNILLI